MATTFSELTQSYASLVGARAAWFTHARNTADVIAVLGLVGPSDRLVVYAPGFEASFSSRFSARQLAFATEPGPDAMIAATGLVPAPGELPDDVDAEHTEHHASYASGSGARFERLYWFVDGIGGRGLRVANIRAFADAAREAGAILMIDNTVASFFGCRPLDLGAHISLEALDRVAAGELSAKTVALAVAPSVHGRGRRRREDPLAEDAYLALAMRLGAGVAPAAGFSAADLDAIERGLASMPGRMQAHMDNARAIAAYLDANEMVPWVSYPGLSSHPDRDFAGNVLDHGFGPAIDFELPRGVSAHAFIAVVAPEFRAAPAGGRLTRLSALDGDDGRYIRLFAGVDDPLDIVDSLDQALRMFCNPPHA